MQRKRCEVNVFGYGAESTARIEKGRLVRNEHGAHSLSFS